MSVRTSQHPIRRYSQIALTVAVAAVSVGTPCFADDDDSIDFFKFKNSDFFSIDDKRKDRIQKKKEEEREDEKRRTMDDKWSNRPANPKNIWQDTFVDTDFSMKTFQDLKNSNDLSALSLMRSGSSDIAGSADDDGRRPEDDDFDVDRSDRDDYRKRMKDDDIRTFRDLTAPIPYMLHDWVPSKPDRGQNGAFTGAPDNGAVVPYKLNGWVEIQRKLPWEAGP